MKALNEYVNEMNRWESYTTKTPNYTFPLSQKMVDKIGSSLDCDLSPENLHCDGEISMSEADQKYRFYERVYRDLEKYCLNNWLNTPELYEL